MIAVTPVQRQRRRSFTGRTIGPGPKNRFESRHRGRQCREQISRTDFDASPVASRASRRSCSTLAIANTIPRSSSSARRLLHRVERRQVDLHVGLDVEHEPAHRRVPAFAAGLDCGGKPRRRRSTAVRHSDRSQVPEPVSRWDSRRRRACPPGRARSRVRSPPRPRSEVQACAGTPRQRQQPRQHGDGQPDTAATLGIRARPADCLRARGWLRSESRWQPVVWLQLEWPPFAGPVRS